MKKILIVVMTSLFVQHFSLAQTASSLFWRSDSLQVNEIVSETGNQYNKVGHHGPAVENSHMALRIYFNDTGAIDLYTKSGRGMELKEYKWYPDSLQLANGAGNDEYLVGKTVGLGGIALWDGEKEVKLVATKGRTARVGDTKKGSFAEMIAYGVEYSGDLVDISVRIDMNAKTRDAIVTAKELSGRKVMFLTGINYHEGQTVRYDSDHILVWGVHIGGKIPYVTPIGAAMTFSDKMFPTVEKTENMVRAISKPSAEVRTKVVATSTREAELNTMKRFEAFIFN